VRNRPSVREAVFEALVGAVYLDRGIATAEEFVGRALGVRIDPEHLLATSDDPKTQLQEVVQGRGLGLPLYRIVSREGPAHAPTFTAEVSIGDRLTGAGAGPSKQAAEQAAAADAMGRFEATERRGPGRRQRP
jgi:ribonuclease-3